MKFIGVPKVTRHKVDFIYSQKPSYTYSAKKKKKSLHKLLQNSFNNNNLGLQLLPPGAFTLLRLRGESVSNETFNITVTDVLKIEE